MDTENKEKAIKQLGISLIIVLLSFIYTVDKYFSLKDAYKEAEESKVWYCKEYYKLKCK